LAIALGLIVPLAVGHALVGVLMAAREGSAAWQWAAAIPVPSILGTHLGGLWQQAGRLWMVIAGGMVLSALGLADDKWGLDWRIRLGTETAVAGAMVAMGFRMSLFIDVPWLTAVISVVWIVGLINSFNMLDNMDGLSAGVAAIAALLLTAVMLSAPDPETRGPQLFVAGWLLVLAGSLLGFLWHNRPPARLFMGDCGSYLVGYSVAMATITATFAGKDVLNRHAILAPLCVLAVPLYDTITVVLIRLQAGKSPFEGDRNHFSHRLVDLGLSKGQAVLFIYLTTTTTGLGALVLYQVDVYGAIVIILLVAFVLVLIAILETTARRKMNE
jgi:UDP-GlcNAc:undecaprenyl-phosphate GlcNAc-1-phosphate transferase